MTPLTSRRILDNLHDDYELGGGDDDPMMMSTIDLQNDPALDTSQLIEDFQRESRAALDQSLYLRPSTSSSISKAYAYEEPETMLHDRSGRFDFNKVRSRYDANNRENEMLTPISRPSNPFQRKLTSTLTPPDTVLQPAKRTPHLNDTAGISVLHICRVV